MHPYFEESVLVSSQCAYVSYWKEENGDERWNGIYLEKMQSYRFRTKVGRHYWDHANDADGDFRPRLQKVSTSTSKLSF